MNSTIYETRVRLKYFGHLAEDYKGGDTSVILSDSPSVFFIDGIETPCMAYFKGQHGIVCYINDADANAYARRKYNQKSTCL